MRLYMQIVGAVDCAPRFYQLILQEELLGGWSLMLEWGVQGARSRCKREDFPDRDKAEQALLACRDIQLERGYRVVFVHGEEASG